MHRLTITLDDDLYAMARAHAVTTRTSISKAISDLLRRQPVPPANRNRQTGVHPLSGFPVSEGDGRPITNEDVRRAMDDDLVRPMEIIGLSPEEIEQALNS